MPSLSFPLVLVGWAATILALGAAGFGMELLRFFCPLHQSSLLVAHPLVRSRYGGSAFYQDWLFFFFIFFLLATIAGQKTSQLGVVLSSGLFFICIPITCTDLCYIAEQGFSHGQFLSPSCLQIVAFPYFCRGDGYIFALLNIIHFLQTLQLLLSLSPLQCCHYCHPLPPAHCAGFFLPQECFYHLFFFFLSTAPPVPLTKSPSLSSHWDSQLSWCIFLDDDIDMIDAKDVLLFQIQPRIIWGPPTLIPYVVEFSCCIDTSFFVIVFFLVLHGTDQ
jgi:hypothetical protein